MTKTLDLINAIEAGQSMKIHSLFEELVNARLVEAIEQRRAEIADLVFNGPVDESSDHLEAGSRYKITKPSGDWKSGTIHVHKEQSHDGKGPKKAGMHYKITHRSNDQDDYEDWVHHNEIKNLGLKKVDEARLDEEFVQEMSQYELGDVIEFMLSEDFVSLDQTLKMNLGRYVKHTV